MLTLAREVTMHHSRLLVGLSLAVAAAAPAAAQDAATSGVLTESSRPIVGAAVTIDGAKTVFTDQDGRFSDSLAAGDHKIQVALHGYQPVERTLTAVRGQALIADFALQPLLQIMALSIPSPLMQGQTGRALLLVKNNATTSHSINAAALNFLASDGSDRGANFTTPPDPGNPALIRAGETVTLAFSIRPADNASPGNLTVRAGILAFDTAMGKSLLTNGSFEAGDASSAPPWVFALDNGALFPGATDAIVTGTAVTGSRSVQIHVPEARAGDVRAYWSSDAVALKPGTTYVLSGYVKTDSIQSAPGVGAAIYVPVVHNSPAQQPNAAFITGTRDWRKETLVFRTSDQTDNGANHLDAFIRGEIQQSTGTAWFDNLTLTEGTEDGSLTLTGGDQVLQVTAMPPAYTPPAYTPPGYVPPGY
jgi:hypothetical protein